MLGKSRRRAANGLLGKTALMLATGWRLQYRTLRCASECFERVFVLGTDEARPLRRSEWCQEFAIIREFDEAAPAAVNALASRWEASCVLPSDGATTRFLAQHRHAVSAKCYPVPDVDTFDVLNNKYTFTRLCQRLGVAAPRTWLITHKQELLQLLSVQQRGMSFVVKPLDRWGGEGVHVLRNDLPWDVIDAIDYEPMLAQEFAKGDDLCAFFCCRRGTVLAQVVYRNTANALHFIRHEAVERACRIVIEELSFDGVVGFDLRESRDGHTFVECNPRFWNNMEIAMLAGINFVEIGVKGTVIDCGQVVGVTVLKGSSAFCLGSMAKIMSREWRYFASYYMSDVPMVLAFGVNTALRRLGLQ